MRYSRKITVKSLVARRHARLFRRALAEAAAAAAAELFIRFANMWKLHECFKNICMVEF